MLYLIEWNKFEFHSFVQGCERFGRKDYYKISQHIGTKAPEEIEEYSKVFWDRISELPEYQKYQKNIERGENYLQTKLTSQSLVDGKCSSLKNPKEEIEFNPIFYNKSRSKLYSLDHDKFLVYITFIERYGNWDKIRIAIKREPRFRFDHFFKSRTDQELLRRIQSLIKVLEKEKEAQTTSTTQIAVKYEDIQKPSRPKPKPASSMEEKDFEGDEFAIKKKIPGGGSAKNSVMEKGRDKDRERDREDKEKSEKKSEKKEKSRDHKDHHEKHKKEKSHEDGKSEGKHEKTDVEKDNDHEKSKDKNKDKDKHEHKGKEKEKHKDKDKDKDTEREREKDRDDRDRDRERSKHRDSSSKSKHDKPRDDKKMKQTSLLSFNQVSGNGESRKRKVDDMEPAPKSTKKEEDSGHVDKKVKVNDKEKDKEDKERDRNREKDREKERDKSRDKDRERERERESKKEKERDREREKDRDREREKDRDRDREKDKENHREKDRENREKEREKDKEKDRESQAKEEIVKFE